MGLALDTVTTIDRHNRAANTYPKNLIDLMPMLAVWVESRRFNTEIYLTNPDENAKNNALYVIHSCNENIKNILAIVDIPKTI